MQEVYTDLEKNTKPSGAGLLSANKGELYTHQVINRQIKESGVDTNLISDGYHTFGELYDHRCILYILLTQAQCQVLQLCHDIRLPVEDTMPVWRSRKHHDGSEWDGWFIMGMGKELGNQISYHLPIKYWDKTAYAETLEQAPEWDGHTSADVLKRFSKLLMYDNVDLEG